MIPREGVESGVMREFLIAHVRLVIPREGVERKLRECWRILRKDHVIPREGVESIYLWILRRP